MKSWIDEAFAYWESVHAGAPEDPALVEEFDCRYDEIMAQAAEEYEFLRLKWRKAFQASVSGWDSSVSTGNCWGREAILAEAVSRAIIPPNKAMDRTSVGMDN